MSHILLQLENKKIISNQQKIVSKTFTFDSGLIKTKVPDFKSFQLHVRISTPDGIRAIKINNLNNV